MLMYAIGNDHTGVALKEIIKKLLESRGIEVKDFGTQSTEASNYAEIAEVAANAVASGECERGILICGTGLGMSYSANKVRGIRAACCSEPLSAKLSKIHNDANILCFGARIVGTEMAKMIVECWLDAKFEGGRHIERLNRITEIENRQYGGR
ncbi:MAG: ribose 5-phosphate isomerase B [Clostridiales bacterium]|nr:ribose 5-phosphate isomerase B [Clostridiales bacterium]